MAPLFCDIKYKFSLLKMFERLHEKEAPGKHFISGHTCVGRPKLIKIKIGQFLGL